MDWTYREIIDWLESPDGEYWSSAIHNTDGFRTFLVTIKPDDYEDDLIYGILWYA